MDRLIRIFVRDKCHAPLPGAEVTFYIDGDEFSRASSTEGQATLQIPGQPPNELKVIAEYPGEKPQSEILADNVDNFTFTFNVRGGYSTMAKNLIGGAVALAIVLGILYATIYLGKAGNVLPLAVGVLLLVIALGLAFTFGRPTLLQAQLIRATFALSLGAIASQVPGLLDIKLTLGTQAAISAAGAIAVFVITFFFVPARDRD